MTHKKNTRIKLIYIAGPYSARDRAGVEKNIATATEAAKGVAACGGMPLCPHANTSDEDFEHLQPYEFWLEGTLELLRRCDAVLLCAGWQRSRGSLGEAIDAVGRSIPVFDDLTEVDKFVKGETYTPRFSACHEAVLRSKLRSFGVPREQLPDDSVVRSSLAKLVSWLASAQSAVFHLQREDVWKNPGDERDKWVAALDVSTDTVRRALLSLRLPQTPESGG
jgi:hypothetical protein